VIAVLASRFDDPTRAAVSARRLPAEVVPLTIDDLLSAGWIVPTQDVADSSFVAAGQVRYASDLAGVVNLLPRVYDFDLFGIRRRDRSYVSGELFAFLVWWLRALPCPVLNRPTPACLNGPSWHPEQWARACLRADIPVAPARVDSMALASRPPVPPDETCATTVVCQRAHGNVYAEECRVLSTLAGTDFLEVFFRKESGGWVFHGVNLMPRIERPDVREMVASALLNEPIKSSRGAALGVA
jgi:hypothetical protein